MILKSYFDGGNEADSTQYDVLTLAVISGTIDQLRPLETAWWAVLKDNHVDFLHTTDAVALSGPFSKRKGWTASRRDNFITECVSAIEPFLVRKTRPKVRPRFGVYPNTVSIVLKDHQRIQAIKADMLKDATEIVTIQALHRCLEWGRDLLGAHFYHFIFDQGEPFRGHIEDRRQNKKARREFSGLARITLSTEADMRLVPALQVADLFAWCVSHSKSATQFPWQRRLLTLDRMDDWITSAEMMNPTTRTLELIREWKLPRRKPTR